MHLQAIAYGFLDFFTKVVFGWIIMLSLGPVHEASTGYNPYLQS